MIKFLVCLSLLISYVAPVKQDTFHDNAYVFIDAFDDASKRVTSSEADSDNDLAALPSSARLAPPILANFATQQYLNSASALPQTLPPIRAPPTLI